MPAEYVIIFPDKRYEFGCLDEKNSEKVLVNFGRRDRAEKIIVRTSISKTEVRVGELVLPSRAVQSQRGNVDLSQGIFYGFEKQRFNPGSRCTLGGEDESLMILLYGNRADLPEIIVVRNGIAQPVRVNGLNLSWMEITGRKLA